MRESRLRFYAKGGQPWNKGKQFEHLLGNKHAFKGDDAGVNAGNARAQKIMKDVRVCRDCDKEKESFQMVVHHVDGNTLNNDLSNLVRLCRSCHIAVHRADLLSARGIIKEPTL